MINEPLTKKYFDCEDVDGDIFTVRYHNCTLKMDIGPYPVGSKIYLIELDLELSKLKLYETEEDADTGPYSIKLSLELV